MMQEELPQGFGPLEAFNDMLLHMRRISRYAHGRIDPARQEPQESDEATDARIARYQQVFGRETAADVFASMSNTLKVVERRFLAVEVAAYADPALFPQLGAPALFRGAVDVFKESLLGLHAPEMLEVLETHRDGILEVEALKQLTGKMLKSIEPQLKGGQ